MARDKYLEKFIDAGFADLKSHLERIETKTETRHADNDKRLTALEKDMGFLKNLFKGAIAFIGAGASAVGIWKGLR